MEERVGECSGAAGVLVKDRVGTELEDVTEAWVELGGAEMLLVAPVAGTLELKKKRKR